MPIVAMRMLHNLQSTREHRPKAAAMPAAPNTAQNTIPEVKLAEFETCYKLLTAARQAGFQLASD